MQEGLWWDESWSPITGCSPISEGCSNCWAKRMAQRLKGRYGYPEDDPFKVTWHQNQLYKPTHWRKPRRIFVCSMSDIFHGDVKSAWVNDVWLQAYNNPKHTFIFLTKRPERMERWTRMKSAVTTWPINEIWPENCWLGVTAENQKRADERIPILLQIPAVVRFVSVEPMLGPVDLSRWLPDSPKEIPFRLDSDVLQWIIAGCESGPGRRKAVRKWFEDLKSQCVDAGVPFFLKQMETYNEWDRNKEIEKMPMLHNQVWDQYPK